MGDTAAVQHAATVWRLVRSADPDLIGRRSWLNHAIPNGAIPTGATPNDAALNEAIIDSWRRCALKYSLDPVRRYDPCVVDSDSLSERRDRHAELLRIAAAEIDWLYEYIAGSGYALVLTDACGVVLYQKTDSALADTFHAAGLHAGADWSEPREGTNGIGTCIAEDRPIIIHRGEHFRACHTGLTCLGSPIRDPAGSLLAVLDASTLSVQQPGAALRHTMALVNMSARLIEKCLFLQYFREEVVVRFHPRPEFVNLQHGGAMALARDASILAVDEAAMRLLGASVRSDLIGRRIDEVFEVRAEEIVDYGKLHALRDVSLGRRFYASVDRASGGSSCIAAPPVAQPRVMRLAPSASRKAPMTLEELAGEDAQMLRNVRSAHRIASSRVPVMIQGPTGAGKEMFARALHAASGRAAMPFIAVNCAAIPESLIESELFGYRPGAFTGARREGLKGKLLQSSGGTLFLDEIGDMPVLLQTRLLRVLEDEEVAPLGAERPIKVDLRVICASHRNLRAMIAQGQFREDLYYRLNGITLELPPLAARSDKERLIREFLAAETSDGRPAAIEMDAFEHLLAYRWPGNIRELRNVIRTALAICDGGVVRLRDLPSEVRNSEVRNSEVRTSEVRQPPPAHAQHFELEHAAPAEHPAAAQSAHKDQILSAIREAAGNMSRAAQRLQISRNTLYRRCRSLGIALRRPHWPP